MRGKIFKRNDFRQNLPAEIPFNDRSQIWLVFGLAGPVLIGLWLFFVVSAKTESLLWFWIFRVAAFSLIFPAVFYLGRTLQAGTQKKPGLIIDEDGFEDRSGPAALGRIYWRDVTDLRKNRSGDSILVDLADPDKYIQAQFSPFKPRHIKQNLQETEAPIRIRGRALAAPLNDVLAMMVDAYGDFHKKQR